MPVHGAVAKAVCARALACAELCYDVGATGVRGTHLHMSHVSQVFVLAKALVNHAGQGGVQSQIVG